MFFFIFIISLVIFFCSIGYQLKTKKFFTFNKKQFSTYITNISGIIAFFSILIIIDLIPVISSENVYQQKIEMYERENDKIKSNIDNFVNEYLQNNNNVLFDDLKSNENNMNLVTLIPELKSNNTIQDNLNEYITNNKQIEQLIEEKNVITNIKWLVYFSK